MVKSDTASDLPPCPEGFFGGKIAENLLQRWQCNGLSFVLLALNAQASRLWRTLIISLVRLHMIHDLSEMQVFGLSSKTKAPDTILLGRPRDVPSTGIHWGD